MMKEVLIKMLAENPDAVVALVHGYIELDYVARHLK